MKVYIIGISDNRNQILSPEIEEVIASHTVFSGGERHHEIMKPHLPESYEWISITVPLSNVFHQYRSFNEIVVFASGDPLFYGFANTVLREMPEAEVKVFPFFNSLQLLSHRLLIGYQNMHIVSLTGRPWHKFDEALIQGYETIGILTDRKVHTPSTIATRMLQYGYDNYLMYVGENLGNTGKERVSEFTINEVIEKEFSYPNNIILRRTKKYKRPLGIPESEFHLLNDRAKMITKMPVRLLSLSMLNLRDCKVFWDIGFCTGSVSVEAKMQFPHLHIVAFEKRAEGEELIRSNATKFRTPGIDAIIGDFTQIDVSQLPAPGAVFIGGHGGKMKEIIEKVSHVISDNGVVVFNSVSDKSKQLFIDSLKEYQLQLQTSIRLKVDEFNAIDVMKAVVKRVEK